MVLFKSCVFLCNFLRLLYLHSTMVLFKLYLLLYWTIFSLFTFHYGPIQINGFHLFVGEQGSFTFHYGPIQININFINNPFQQDLHSTMVLFKFDKDINIYNRKRFTFHYGPIQMVVQCSELTIINYLHSTMVLFK